MLELVSYGLTGLAALVIVASYLAYSGEFSLWRKRSTGRFHAQARGGSRLGAAAHASAPIWQTRCHRAVYKKLTIK
jgi:hypothetical protein